MSLYRTGGGLALGVILVGATACATGDTARLQSAEDVGEPRNAVTAEEIEQRQSRSLADLLVGRVAGVEVMRTANGIAVRIRGAVSTHGNTSPLYVLDGMPIHAGPAGELAGLSVSEIASIEVLKDAVDTTFYGARGANGVIVITTRKADG